MASQKNPEDGEQIEENEELKTDRDADPGESVAIELPVKPDDANAQPL